MTTKKTKTKKPYVIMIVEDDRFLNKAYADKLSRAGFEVQLATSADEAYKQLEVKKPDIILLDIIMPRKSGFEFLGELKMNPKFKKIPIIIISNLSQEEDLVKGKNLGAVDFLVKTELGLDEIVEKVTEVLVKKKK